MPSPSRSAWRNPFLTTLVVLASITALALLANLGASFGIYSRDDYRVAERMVRAPSRIYDHGFRSNATATVLWGQRTYALNTNSLGFRDRQVRHIDLRSSPHRRRIVFLGDSFTEGQGVNFEDTFVGLFAASNPHLDVVNAAVSSYAPSLYVRKIASLLEAGFKFDELWVFVDLSDVQDEATSYFFCDAFGQERCPDQGTNVADTRPAYFADLRPGVSNRERVQEIIRRRMVDERWGDFFPLFKPLLALPSPARVEAFSEIVRNPRGAWPLFPDEQAFAPLGIQGGLKKALAQMEALHRLLVKNNIALNVAVYPWPAQMNFLATPDDQHVQIWRAYCQGRCQHFVNLYEDFFQQREHLGPRNWYAKLFITGDDHFNEAGHQIIATRLDALYSQRARLTTPPPRH